MWQVRICVPDFGITFAPAAWMLSVSTVISGAASVAAGAVSYLFPRPASIILIHYRDENKDHLQQFLKITPGDLEFTSFKKKLVELVGYAQYDANLIQIRFINVSKNLNILITNQLGLDTFDFNDFDVWVLVNSRNSNLISSKNQNFFFFLIT